MDGVCKKCFHLLDPKSGKCKYCKRGDGLMVFVAIMLIVCGVFAVWVGVDELFKASSSMVMNNW